MDAGQISKPFVGVVNSFNEVVPGHSELNRIARAVKDGILMAGFVISLKTMRQSDDGSSPRMNARCQAIASPSRSGSLAR